MSGSRLVLTFTTVLMYTCKCDGRVWASEKVSLERSAKSNFLPRFLPRPGRDLSEVRIPFKGYLGHRKYDSLCFQRISIRPIENASFDANFGKEA